MLLIPRVYSLKIVRLYSIYLIKFSRLSSVREACTPENFCLSSAISCVSYYNFADILAAFPHPPPPPKKSINLQENTHPLKNFPPHLRSLNNHKKASTPST